MREVTRRLDASDWVLIGYLLGIMLMWAVDHLGGDEERPRSSEQHVTLTEQHLRRIEDGETLKVHRWHGHELVLGGDMVIDAGEVEDA